MQITKVAMQRSDELVALSLEKGNVSEIEQ